MINEDKAACLLYLRIPHKNPKIGYLLCNVVCLYHVLGRQTYKSQLNECASTYLPS